jgi:hypothetical protein
MTQRPESQSEKEKLNYRWERIQRLLAELRYEVQRGMMEGEIDEQIGYRFVVPVSKAIPNGVVMCEFRTRPQPAYCVNIEDHEPRLRVVK